MTDPIQTRPVFDPVTQHFLDSLVNETASAARSPSDFRTTLAQLQSVPVGKPGAMIQDLTFPVGPTGTVGVRIVRPRKLRGALPVVMYFHGGGWVAGDTATHDRLMREIAVSAGAALVFVSYDRSPEARFPIAVEQGYAVMRYVVDHARKLNVDATRLAVLGDGAGGNIAAATILLAKQRRGPTISLQVLLYPMTDAFFDTGSYQEFATGAWLTRAAMQTFWDNYFPDPPARHAILATPLNAPVEALQDLPETLVIVAENDVVRDEGEAYARKMADAGVRVTSVRYIGAIHDFILLNALADTPAARSATAQIVSALKSAFG